ncbi:MAG: hypothetical protein JAZ02_16350, partial [Candidatus Thiodiazotropha endolucinida]|nr:hypothetical protein [Candidatus Thiodiazotropha endolucinida]
KGPAKRFSSTGAYIAGSYYRVMPLAPNIVLYRQMYSKSSQLYYEMSIDADDDRFSVIPNENKF